MIDFTPELADSLLDDMHERERVSFLCDCDLVSEAIFDDDIDIDHPLIAEMLRRLDPLWLENWSERGH